MATSGVIELSANKERERGELESVKMLIGGKQMGWVTSAETIDELG